MNEQKNVNGIVTMTSLPENTEGILYMNVLTVFIGTPFKGSCILLIMA